MESKKFITIFTLDNKTIINKMKEETKKVVYDNMFYRPNQEITLKGEQFMIIKDAINRITIDRTRLVYNQNGQPIGRTEVGIENEDIATLNKFISDLHKAFIDEGLGIEREELLKELEADESRG